VHDYKLVCTFANKNDFGLVEKIILDYAIVDRNIYIYTSTEDDSRLYFTYCIPTECQLKPNTIYIHRKNITNTFFTINSLNILIQRINNGVLDKNYEIDWFNYKDSIILVANNILNIDKIEKYKIIC